MITPDLPLARAITTAVLDRIERDRTISSEGITEAVLGKLLYANAVAGEGPKADDDITKLARDLVRAMQRDTRIKDIGADTALAYSALARAVNR